MPIEICGLLEDVETYEGKNGFGANITISQKIDKRTKRLDFRITDKEQATKLESLLDTAVTLILGLEQNNFGLRISGIMKIVE